MFVHLLLFLPKKIFFAVFNLGHWKQTTLRMSMLLLHFSFSNFDSYDFLGLCKIRKTGLRRKMIEIETANMQLHQL